MCFFGYSLMPVMFYTLFCIRHMSAAVLFKMFIELLSICNGVDVYF